MNDQFIKIGDIDVPGAADVNYRQGETLLREGAAIEGIYVVRSGFAAVQRFHHGKLVEIARLKSGDVFGEISLLDDGAASASVVAAEDCTIRLIRRQDLEALFCERPDLGVQVYKKLARVLAQRLRETMAMPPLMLG
jgi:CRP-like cAMP-binding protein